MPPWAAPVAAAFVLAAFTTAVMWRMRARLPVATPNARSLHVTPIPRVAGLAIWVGFVPATTFAQGLPGTPFAAWAIPWLAVSAVSLRDDMSSVGIAARLAVHAFAAVWFAIATGMPAWLVVIAALAIGWSMNLYNFMDGSDGLAVTMAVIGFTAYGIALSAARMPADLPLCLAAATVPVLFVNRPPARMFLGDVGAVPLGFFAAAFGIAGIAAGAWQAWFPLLVFLPFAADATATLLRRMAARERFWESHKSHHYQRLHQLGAGHAGTLSVFAALMLGCALTAIGCVRLAPQWGWPALAAWCAVHAGVFAAIDYHWRARSLPPSST